MGQKITYGLGGYDPTKPNNNIISIEEFDVPETTDNSIDAIAQALAQLPPETLQALKQALGIGE